MAIGQAGQVDSLVAGQQDLANHQQTPSYQT